MLTITETTDKKIYLKGTDIELQSVMARVEFWAKPSGKELQAFPTFYQTEASYNNGEGPIAVTGVEGFINDATDYSLSNGDNPETFKAQTIQEAHELLKASYEALGYTVAIIGL